VSAPVCLQCGTEFDYDPGVYHEKHSPECKDGRCVAGCPQICGPVENGTGPVGGWDKAQDISGGKVEVRWPKDNP
jgi:hypothetical protein